jgi:hypothetical protein
MNIRPPAQSCLTRSEGTCGIQASEEARARRDSGRTGRPTEGPGLEMAGLVGLILDSACIPNFSSALYATAFSRDRTRADVGLSTRALSLARLPNRTARPPSIPALHVTMPAHYSAQDASARAFASTGSAATRPGQSRRSHPWSMTWQAVRTGSVSTEAPLSSRQALGRTDRRAAPNRRRRFRRTPLETHHVAGNGPSR